MSETSEPVCEWVYCPECGGDEGYTDDDGQWHDCDTCEGAGGHAE